MAQRDHDHEPNTGMRVGGDGNKIHGDDLEEVIPGHNPGKERVRRGAETFDIEGERITRVGEPDDDNAADEDNRRRGAETFDIEGERPDSDERTRK